MCNRSPAPPPQETEPAVPPTLTLLCPLVLYCPPHAGRGSRSSSPLRRLHPFLIFLYKFTVRRLVFFSFTRILRFFYIYKYINVQISRAHVDAFLVPRFPSGTEMVKVPVCNGGRAWPYWATSVTRPRTDAILFFSNCLSVSGVVSASLVTEEDAPGQCARVLPAPAASDGNQCLSHSRLCCLVIVAPIMTVQAPGSTT